MLLIVELYSNSRPGFKPPHISKERPCWCIQRPTVETLAEADGNRQRFAVTPLEPGFGYTIGNSLRRTLLSSIPVRRSRPCASTTRSTSSARSTESPKDVTDVILNLKDIVLQSTSDDPVVVRLDVRGPAKVTAGGHQPAPPRSRFLNPEHHIATLNQRGRLAIDLTVERGRGYLSAERPAGTSTIGIIPIDAIFSPVRRVTFNVEPTRVEQSTNYDRLVLDIETDGSITPREALASAGATLRSLVELVAEMSDAPMGLELGEVVGVNQGSPDLDHPIEDLDLSSDPATA